MTQKHLSSLTALFLLLSPTFATAKNNDNDGIFRIGTLPKGKNVTIPRPATTQIPVASRVVLTPTDMPQSISMKPVNVTNGPTGMLRVAIYDQNSDRVKYIELSPSTPFVYQVKNLQPITVIPEERGGATSSLVLQVQSDKPLQIAH